MIPEKDQTAPEKKVKILRKYFHSLLSHLVYVIEEEYMGVSIACTIVIETFQKNKSIFVNVSKTMVHVMDTPAHVFFVNDVDEMSEKGMKIFLETLNLEGSLMMIH